MSEQGLEKKMAKPGQSLFYGFAFLSVAWVLALMWMSWVGLDLLDEGFALNAIKNPDLYQGLFTRFGYIVAPIFRVLGENLPLLRIVHLLYVYLGSVALIYCALSKFLVSIKLSNQLKLIRLNFAMAMGGSGLMALWPFLTPSYGSLAFDGCLLIAIVVALQSFGMIERFLFIRLVALSCVVAGAFIVMSSKITSGILLLIALCLYSLLLPTSLFCIGAVASVLLFLFHGIATQGSLAAFLGDMTLASHILSGYEANAFSLEDMFWRFLPGIRNCLGFAIGLVLLIFAGIGIFKPEINPPSRSCLMKLLNLLSRRHFGLALFVLAGLFASIGLMPFVANKTHFVDVFRCAALSFVYMAAIFIYFRFSFEPKSLCLLSIPRLWNRSPLAHAEHNRLASQLLSSLFLLFLPFICAFGTSNGFYEYASNYLVFSFAGLIILISAYLDFFGEKPDGLSISEFLPKLLVVSSFLLSACLWQLYVVSPFGRNSILSGPYQWSFTRYGNLLIDSQSCLDHQYLLTHLDRLGFRENDYFLDLTAQFPGMMALLGAKPLGWPWILGMSPGASEVALRILRPVSASVLDESWILISSESLNNLDASYVLKSLGVDVSSRTHHRMRSNDAIEGSINCKPEYFTLLEPVGKTLSFGD